MQAKPAAIKAAPAAAAAAAAKPTARTLVDVEAAVLEVVRDLVGGDVDVGEPLAGQGLDSLAAMELRQKLQVGAMPQSGQGGRRCKENPLPTKCSAAAWILH